MGNISIGINLEFVRHEDKSFEWGVNKAAELGYEYVEPMLHWGRELLSEAGYFHSVSMLDDPLRVRRACDAAGVKLSGFSAHTPSSQDRASAARFCRSKHWPKCARASMSAGSRSSEAR